MKIDKIIYIDRFDKWDLTSIVIYLILSMIILNDPNGIITKDIVLGYSFMTTFLLYILNYKSLRKFNVWLIWFLISIFHLYLYREISEISKYQYVRGTAAQYLEYTWIFLIIFQILRFTSLKLQQMELVAPNISGIDYWDKRKINRIDKICAVIYYMIFILIGLF